MGKWMGGAKQAAINLQQLAIGASTSVTSGTGVPDAVSRDGRFVVNFY